MTTPLENLLAAATPLQIPVLENAAYQAQRIPLDGRLYTLTLSWNQWASSWSLSLYDAEDSPILQGLRIISNWPLLRYYKYDPRCPPGELIAHDLTGDGSPPRFDDFGIDKRVELTYYSLS